MLSKELEISLNSAFTNACSKRHEFMTVEHLLLSLMDNESASLALQGCGVDTDSLQLQLVDFVDSTTPLTPENDTEGIPQPTLGFQRVLQRAVFHVQSANEKEVSGVNVLVAMFSEQESQAVNSLKNYGLARHKLVDFINRGMSVDANEEEVEKAFDEEYDESFDYKSLLRLREEEIDAVRFELEKATTERALAIKTHTANKKEYETKINDSEKIIEELKNRIANFTVHGDGDGETILASINFKPEHKQAGLSILAYFSDIIQQKYPEKNVSISITQKSNTVRLIIVTEEGDREIIEKTLDEYGKVAAGIILPKNFLSDPIHIAKLETKLDIAHVEIKSLERILGIQENTISHLKMSFTFISEALSDGQKVLSSAIEKLPNSSSVEAMLDFLKRSSPKESLTHQEIDTIKDTVKVISENHPGHLDELKNYWLNVSSGIVATTILGTLKMLGF